MKRKRWRLKDDAHALADTRHVKPVPSRDYLLNFLTESGELASDDAIAAALGISDEEQLEGLSRRLGAMQRDGQLLRNRNGEYGLVDNMELIRGVVLAHRDGYGFLQPDDGGADLFLTPRTMRSLMHGDRALVRLSREHDHERREGKLVEVLERNTSEVVGRFFRERGAAFVYPDGRAQHQDVLIADGLEAGAMDGQIVVARLIEQPNKRSRPIGEVIQILGEEMAPGMEIEVAIRSHNLPHVFPDRVTAEMQTYPVEVDATQYPGYRDLRQLPLVTIDGADAKDFDDAVYCKATPKGWRLWVAIADVSSYVRPGTALDGEALNRGTSVYFPGRVVPMLPEGLSHGLCSLVPDQDRLALVCEMQVAQSGEVTRSRFYEAVICSHARLTYDEVGDALQHGDADARAGLGTLLPHLEELYRLYRVFASARVKRGCMEFDSDETQIVFGNDKKIDRLISVQRNDAHKIIEECMIAANVCAAKFLDRRKSGGLFRIHETPVADKLEDLRAFLAPLGLRLDGGKEPQAKHYAKLSDSVAERPDARVVRKMMLRSMPQALYEPGNKGHFGLALDAYAHFTSPIRRYPDLIVHRAIKQRLKCPGAANWAPAPERLTELALHCSQTERRADEASRDVVAWLKCEYMIDKLGESFNGTVNSVASFGLFVELDGIYVEGLVHVSTLGSDYYRYDPINLRLTGQRSGESFGLGDRVRVQVARVDLDERKVDFELTSSGAKHRRAKKRRSRKPR